MTPVKEIGEFLITAGEDEYFLRSSFLAMTRIGEPGEIVQAFYDLHNDETTPMLQRAINAYGKIPDWLISRISGQQFSKKTVSAAMTVIAACCDRDTSRLTGELVPGKTGRRTFMYRPGVMTAFDMVAIAQALITHGIIGKAKVRQLQRNETSQASNEFHAFEYVSAARNHFSISREEAQQLSMTEFMMMLAAKYPDQKGYTREEYDKTADDFFAQRERRKARKQNNQASS